MHKTIGKDLHPGLIKGYDISFKKNHKILGKDLHPGLTEQSDTICQIDDTYVTKTKNQKGKYNMST